MILEKILKFYDFSITGIGGFRGVHPVRAPPKGPDSFVLTYKFYET